MISKIKSVYTNIYRRKKIVYDHLLSREDLFKNTTTLLTRPSEAAEENHDHSALHIKYGVDAKKETRRKNLNDVKML